MAYREPRSFKVTIAPYLRGGYSICVQMYPYEAYTESQFRTFDAPLLAEALEAASQYILKVQ